MFYNLDVKTKKCYATSAEEILDEKITDADKFSIDELSEAGYKLRNFTVAHTAVGAFIPGTDLIRVTAKVYAKYGVKTQVVKKTKKSISTKDLANMTPEQLQELISNAKNEEAAA